MAVYVDCSSNNGTPNLPAYRAAGHTDLMLKATEGTGYAWGQMAVLAQQWHSYGPGFRVGYYHWLYGTQSAQAQYGWFWSHVAPVWRAGDWLMTDFEDVDPGRWVSDQQHLNVLRQFNDLCRARGPIHTYTGNWYLANLPLCTAYLRTQPVVMSDYSHTPPSNPHGLNYVAHQFTSSATVAGFQGRVDYNRWLVDATLGGGVPITQKDWFDMATAADLQKIVAVEVNKALDAKLPWWLARAVGLARKGTGNAGFSVKNAGTLVDNVGIDGEIAAVKTATSSGGHVDVDLVALAKAVADEIHARLAA